MAYQIVWTKEAKRSFFSILEYLEKEWTEREIRNFVERVDGKLDLLQFSPAIGMVYKRKYKIYRTLLTKQTSLVYFVRPIKKEIVLLSFWDNRQDPKKFKF